MSKVLFESSAKVGGKVIKVETGHLARQADGAVLASCGQDRVLATVVSAHQMQDLDFFPLTVEYQEKFYSAGRIPGSYFRREARPSYEATLMARMIDRPLRPCFPEGYTCETQIVATTLSYSGECPIGVLAGIAASTAVHISDIPFKGPVSMIQVGQKDGKPQALLSEEDRAASPVHLVVAGHRQGLLMVEGASQFISEDQALEMLKFAHKNLQPLLDMQEDLRKKMGNPEKRPWSPAPTEEDMTRQVQDFLKQGDKIKTALLVPEKKKRSKAMDDLKEEAFSHLKGEADSSDTLALKKKVSEQVFEKSRYELARGMILSSGKRIDGRKQDEVRPIECEVGILPRTHGSALFTRGETQVLGTATLGTGDDEQKLDSLAGLKQNQFLLHYNFPPFSVGETGRMGGQSRREIGHGFLAQRALNMVVPSHEDFPYTIRVVSEVLESNGSSSMGTVCSGCLALMDAGVPIKSPVAGIAMGLIQEKGKTAILSDILGDEDHLGDMDFKVAGTKDGITALQMDIKADSLSFEVMEKALAQAKEGRLHILKEMEKALAAPRKDLSKYAPRIEAIQIKREKIREVIGTGGKMINKIVEETGVKLDVRDTGMIYIASPSVEQIEKAKSIIEGICAEVEEGAVYDGKVVKLADFGAFVEVLPNTSGLLHISEIAHQRIREVSDILNEGDTVRVKVLQVGEGGRIRLSRKVLLEKPPHQPPPSGGGGDYEDSPGGGGGFRENRGGFRGGGEGGGFNKPPRGRRFEDSGRSSFRGGREDRSGNRRGGRDDRFGGGNRNDR